MRTDYGEQNATTLEQIRDGLASLHATARATLASQVCLECGTYTLDATGVLSLGFPQGYRSVHLINLGQTDAMTATAMTVQGAIPGGGPGMGVVPAGHAATLNLAGRALTIYGTAGDSLVVQVFAATQPPAFG